VATYFVGRYGGHWAEDDGQALAIRSLAQAGTLIPPTGVTYGNGYGYAAVSDALLTFTGLTVPQLVQIMYPLVSAALVFPAWALFQELTESRRLAGLATLFLFVQPEFLFVVLRGSHERVLRTLMLLSLWLLVRSFRFRDRPAQFITHVALFYLVAFGLIATNVLFGISFLAAIGTVLMGAWTASRLFGINPQTIGVERRLASSTVALVALASLAAFYVYPPAIHSLGAFKQVGLRLVELFVTTQTGSSPYTQVAGAWINIRTYFLVSFPDYLLIVASMAVWVWQGVLWWRKAESPTFAKWFLWLLYAGFMVQEGLSIIADRAGMLGGNLEYRAFPSLAIVATPMLALACSKWLTQSTATKLAATGLALLTGLALVKATNEPAVSNNWTFYTPAEMLALKWADAHHQYSTIWIGPDTRLKRAFELDQPQTGRHNEWQAAPPNFASRSLIVSDVMRLQSVRLNRTLPPLAAANKVYDNGSVELYRMLPITVFQR
jgi:hypothetical protein